MMSNLRTPEEMIYQTMMGQNCGRLILGQDHCDEGCVKVEIV